MTLYEYSFCCLIHTKKGELFFLFNVFFLQVEKSMILLDEESNFPNMVDMIWLCHRCCCVFFWRYAAKGVFIFAKGSYSV